MSNSVHSRTSSVPAGKASQTVSLSNENMAPQNGMWRFFSGDRLAYLVIAVAVCVGITVFFALSRVTDINIQSKLLVFEIEPSLINF